MPVARVARKYWEQIAASSVQLAAHVAIAAPLRITAGVGSLTLVERVAATS